jgi:hypothetical protein
MSATNDIPTRVAVLERIASDTRDALIEMRADMRELRAEMRALRAEARSDYRWLLSIMLGGFAALLGVMAHGFHWL